MSTHFNITGFGAQVVALFSQAKPTQLIYYKKKFTSKEH